MRPSSRTTALALPLLFAAACAHTPAPQPDSGEPARHGTGTPATGNTTPEPAAQSEPAALPEGGFVRLSAPAGGALCGVEPQGPNVVVLGCQGMTIKAMRVMIVTPETLLEQMLGMPEWSATTVRIADRDVDGGLLRDTASSDPRTGIAVASQHAEPPLMLSCFGPAGDATEQRCRGVLAVLAVEGLPQGVHFAEAPLSLAGRALEAPAGCRITGANDRIVCAGAELHWRDPSPHCRGTTQEQRSSFQAMLASVGQVEHAAVTCSVMGQEAACDRWLLRAPGRAPATVLVSGIGCGQPMAQCNFLNTTPQTMPQRYPPPCDQLFEGVPPAVASVKR